MKKGKTGLIAFRSRTWRDQEFCDYGFPCRRHNADTGERFGSRIPIFKMHGSSNWTYCDNCKDVGYALGEKLALTVRADLRRDDFAKFSDYVDKRILDRLDMELDRQSKCAVCGNDSLSCHIATFSYQKSFRNPAYPQIWQRASEVLARSDKWVFIGYSLPEADFELKHLLKTAQLFRSRDFPAPKSVFIVTKSDSDWEIGKYRSFFGSAIRNEQTSNDGLNPETITRIHRFVSRQSPNSAGNPHTEHE